MQGKYRQQLLKTQFGCYPFFCIPFPLVGVLAGSACLASWLLGFGENTYGDGWIMDRDKYIIFARWLIGLFAMIVCVIQCLMDMQCFLFVCLVDGIMDGWMDGWMIRRKEGWMDGWIDGWMLYK